VLVHWITRLPRVTGKLTCDALCELIKHIL